MTKYTSVAVANNTITFTEGVNSLSLKLIGSTNGFIKYETKFGESTKASLTMRKNSSAALNRSLLTISAYPVQEANDACCTLPDPAQVSMSLGVNFPTTLDETAAWTAVQELIAQINLLTKDDFVRELISGQELSPTPVAP